MTSTEKYNFESLVTKCAISNALDADKVTYRQQLSLSEQYRKHRFFDRNLRVEIYRISVFDHYIAIYATE